MSAAAETIVIARAPVVTPSRGTPSPPKKVTARKTPRRQTPQQLPQQQGRPRRARTGVFVAFVLTILTLGLLGMLMVNTALATGAFTLNELQSKKVQLTEAEQALSEQLARAESPVLLEDAARALGMVPQDVPVFLRLEDGAILGNPIPQPVPIAPVVPDVLEPGVTTDSVTDQPIVTDPAAETDQVEVGESVAGDSIESPPVGVESEQ